MAATLTDAELAITIWFVFSFGPYIGIMVYVRGKTWLTRIRAADAAPATGVDAGTRVDPPATIRDDRAGVRADSARATVRDVPSD